MAAVSTVFSPIQASVGMAFPAHLAGRALTAYNLVLFTSVFIVQSGLGVAMDGLVGGGMAQEEAFRVGLAGIAVLQTAAWLLFVFWPKPAVRVSAAIR
jgi:hypothetical protein